MRHQMSVLSLAYVVFWWTAGAIALGVALKAMWLLIKFGWGLL